MPNQNNFDIRVLAANIKLLADKKGITLTRLAIDMNMVQSTISKRLNGKSDFSFKEVYEIAQYFNVSIDDLINSNFSNTVTSESVENDDEENDEHNISNNPVYEVCKGLASIFKHAPFLLIEKVGRNEVVYEEETDYDGRRIGHYHPKKDAFNLNPTNTYPAILFSNYWPVDYDFESQEDHDEYMLELEVTGNTNEQSCQINRFLKKLVDLNNTLKSDSIQLEDYTRAIDNLLSEIPKDR